MNPARVRAAAAALLLAALPAAASEDGRRMLEGAEAAAFSSVGRVEIVGSGFCTGTLISDRLVVTAAHCLYNSRTGERMPPRTMRFVAGAHFEHEAAVRGVRRAVAAPGFRYDGRPDAATLGFDLALLELGRPVPRAAAAPVEIGPVPAPEAALSVVSYGRARPRVASVYEHCPVRAMTREVAALNCSVALGGSGGPVFVGSGPERRLVAVVSASGLGASGMPVTLVVMLEPLLGSLRGALDAAGG